jgi:hypothetical protein
MTVSMLPYSNEIHFCLRKRDSRIELETFELLTTLKRKESAMHKEDREVTMREYAATLETA